MADWWTISGWVMGVGFGGLSVFQFVRDYAEGRVWRERKLHLRAVQRGLVQLRAMLTEASNEGEVIKTEAAKQFVRNVGHQIKTVEHHVDAMLDEDAPPTPSSPPSSTSSTAPT